MHEVHNKTQFVKNSVIDRQPVQLLQSLSYVVTQAKVENKPSCCVQNTLQWFSGTSWQAGQYRVTIVQPGIIVSSSNNSNKKSVPLSYRADSEMRLFQFTVVRLRDVTRYVSEK